MSILDRLFGYAEKKVKEAIAYRENPLGKASCGLKEIGREAEMAIDSVADARSKVVPVLKRMMNDEISIKEFNCIYEVKIYDPHSRRRDIRALKQFDSEGVYAFHNLEEDTYYIGRATYLFKKVKRVIDGYDNPIIHEKMKSGCRYAVSAVRRKDTDCESMDTLFEYYRNRFQSKL